MKQLGAGLLVLVLALGACAQTRTAPPQATALPSEGPPATIPPGSKTPGEREPVVGFLAVVSIIVAGGAGLYIYRVIRKGL